MRIGVYPGSFDPITFGHLDIINRSKHVFDKLYVVIPSNPNKKTLFTVEERLGLLKAVLKDDKDYVEIVTTDLLTVDFAHSVNAHAMLRGLRMMSDFEFEAQLSTINRRLNQEIETIFIMSSHELTFLSSSIVKEIAFFKGDVSSFVPKEVEMALKQKYQ